MTLALYLVGGCQALLIVAVIIQLLCHLVCKRCDCDGHAWERFEARGVHYRQAAIEASRVCKRCGRTERIGSPRGYDGDLPGIEPTWIPPTPSPKASSKPSLIPLPTDGRSVTR